MNQLITWGSHIVVFMGVANQLKTGGAHIVGVYIYISNNRPPKVNGNKKS